ncbi:NAD(P)H-hydrate dehydratase [Gordonia sp. HY285]|uniref:NAD(P)H-hydrate dehydratase n=1 Tax=Gordonia liuliyuniae TaxID=2911517 RepID=UPI001F028174|nr:NAD(P)H-hydrate dehydratase [Gordonia liuliyuniae]MCF8611654.1 NAD(P)H-hydrate dehydratase [Gordonia liuliyuniae]
MIGFHAAQSIRDAERSTGPLLTDGVLMARAAHGVAATVLDELRRRYDGAYGRTVVLVVGAGDNGGDALYAARHLRGRGVRVRAVLTAPDRVHEAGLADFRAVGGHVTDADPFDGADLVVDAIVGLGGHGPLREPGATLMADVAQAGIPVVAVDLPSGVDPDTGIVHTPSVRADATVTFSLRRLAHLLAAPSCGSIAVRDIGIEAPERPEIASPSDGDVARAWPLPGPSDDKYTQGVVGVIAGSARYPGAAVLATTAAIAATSGMTRYVGSAAAQVVAHRPEAVAVADLDDAGRVQAWVIGPGFGTDSDSADALRRVLADPVPVLVDADALTMLADDADLRAAIASRQSPVLLTPHAGEFTRLAVAAGSTAADLLAQDRLAAVRCLAADLGVTVLLKGRVTLVADSDGTVWGTDAGSSWAATAGSGDVLSGIAGALLAAGIPPREAATMAARLHAHAAARASGGAPIGASDLVAAVAPALRELMRLRQ